MLDFDQHPAREAIRSLVVAGVPEREIHELVNAVAVAERPSHKEISVGDLPIYDELPEGLIDLPSAARKYDRKVSTIYNWIYRGRIRAVGRLRAAARGGGYMVVNEADLVAHMAAPPNRGGRPRST